MATDKSINDLLHLSSVQDDSKIPASQSGNSGYVSGADFKAFAQNAVSGYADTAQTAAQAAAEASVKAQGYSESASASASNAANSASAAGTSATNAANSAQDAVVSAINAERFAQNAEQFANDAQLTGRTFAVAAKEHADRAETAAAIATSTYGAYAVLSASGDQASFDDGAEGVPVKDLTVSIEPVQAGSGDPSPDNVRPISGWTGAKVTRTGKNLLPANADALKSNNPYGTWAGNVYTYNGMEFTLLTDSDGGVTGVQANGTVDTDAVNALFYYPAFVPVAGDYALSGCPAGGNADTYSLRLVRDAVRTVPMIARDAGTGAVFTADGSSYHRLIIQLEAGATLKNAVFSSMIRLASETDDSFEPYAGEIYDISFGDAGTVYGGTLDVTTGVLTVDRAAVDLGGMSWQKINAYNTPVFRSLGIRGRAVSFSPGICEWYTVYPTTGQVVNSSNALVINSTYWSSTETYTMVHDERFETADAFREAVTGVKLVYELATPLTYQLSPQEVTTLLGVNHLFADCGAVSVRYRADPTTLYHKLKNALLSLGGNV